MGHLACDPPSWLVKDALSAVPRDRLKFVIWTGDNPSHDQCWDANKRSSLEASMKLTQIVYDAFPETPVFPTIGNHEMVPIDMFHVDVKVDAWLYNSVADMWGRWLPTSAIETLRAYGYYTALVEEGLRIISLNTNFWIAADWLKISRHEDINHQVEWLEATLAAAESAGEAVYIIGHMPLGDEDQDDDLLLVIRMLLQRYQATVAGLFFGHKHQDVFKVLTDPRDNKTPVATVFVAPAFTPFQHRNPSFRVYEAVVRSKSLVDFHQYRLAPDALSLATSMEDKLAWSHVFSARKEYGLASFNPGEWLALAARAKHDKSLYERMSTNAVTGAAVAHIRPPSVAELVRLHSSTNSLSQSLVLDVLCH